MGPKIISFGHNHMGQPSHLLCFSSNISGPRHHLRAPSARMGLNKVPWAILEVAERLHDIIRVINEVTSGFNNITREFNIESPMMSIEISIKFICGPMRSLFGPMRSLEITKSNQVVNKSKKKSRSPINSFRAQWDHLGAKKEQHGAQWAKLNIKKNFCRWRFLIFTRGNSKIKDSFYSNRSLLVYY